MSLRTRWQQWFFRHTAAEPAPIVLDRRRIYILPSRTGMLYAVVLFAMYIGAINYNLGLGHALVFLLAGIGGVGMLHTYRNLVGMEITPGRCPPVFAGDTISHRFSLRTRDARPRFAITLARGGHLAEIAEVTTESEATIELSYPSTTRGRHPIGRLRISTVYPLGLYRAWSYPYPDSDALVYPRPIITPLPAPIPGSEAGDRLGNLGDEDFSGFRVWQPADSPRHIAWKAFARDPEHQPLQVKTFAGGTTPELWLDWASAPPGAETEDRLSIICGWILQASRDGLRYGLRIPGHEIAPDLGQAHRDRCLERLATFEQRERSA
jgi:uncharacterized protein (DUF58 family)